MGLIYDPADSNGIVTGLRKNLSGAMEVVEQLEKANTQLVGTLDSGSLAGKAYSAARTTFTDTIGPSIEDARQMVDDLQEDLDVYVREDTKVSQFGVLDEDELEAELAAAKELQRETESLIEANRVAADALTSLPAAGAALEVANRQLEMVADQAEQMAREIQEQLDLLRDFDAAIAGLFGAGTPSKNGRGSASAAHVLLGRSMKDILAGMGDISAEDLAEYLETVRTRDPATYWQLLAGMSREDLERLAKSGCLDDLEPAAVKPRGGDTMQWLKLLFKLTSPLEDGVSWRSPENRIMPEYWGAGDWLKLRQKGVGDCWLVASMAVELRDDPGWVARNVSVNPNGTVTVKLRDRVTGEQVPVTVSDRLLYSSQGRISVDGTDVGAYIEKAAAEFYGGDDAGFSAGSYAAIDTDSPSSAVGMFSGRDTTWVSAPQGSDDLVAAVREGKTALVTTPREVTKGAKDEGVRPGHVYVVDRVDGDVIHLLNPWDFTSEGYKVSLTKAEYEAWTNGATIVEQVAR